MASFAIGVVVGAGCVFGGMAVYHWIIKSNKKDVVVDDKNTKNLQSSTCTPPICERSSDSILLLDGDFSKLMDKAKAGQGTYLVIGVENCDAIKNDSVFDKVCKAIVSSSAWKADTYRKLKISMPIYLAIRNYTSPDCGDQHPRELDKFWPKQSSANSAMIWVCRTGSSVPVSQPIFAQNAPDVTAKGIVTWVMSM